jgi:glycerophosphoryl diester phosphodiesterase
VRAAPFEPGVRIAVDLDQFAQGGAPLAQLIGTLATPRARLPQPGVTRSRSRSRVLIAKIALSTMASASNKKGTFACFADTPAGRLDGLGRARQSRCAIVPGKGCLMLVIGHRGFPSRAPENTLASFEAALDLGVDGLELDVHLSRDGHLVVIHDQNLARTTDGQGLVHEHTLAELKALDAGRWYGPDFAGERIPSFEEVLDLVGRRVPLQVEIKGATEGVTEATLAALDARGLLGTVMITSFQLQRLPLVRKLAPSVQIGALVWGRARTPDRTPMTPAECVAATRAAQADVMLLWHECIDEAKMEAARAAQLPLGAAGGTAKEADMRRLLGLGVVRMTTNYPDVCNAVVRGRAAPA